MAFAEVIIDITTERLDRPFTYRIPENLEAEVGVGSCVRIPFGRGNSIIKGYVIALRENAEIPASQIKEIAGVDKKSLPIETELIKLSDQMKKRYGGTIIQSLKTVLPVRKKTKAKQERKTPFPIPSEIKPTPVLNPAQADIVLSVLASYDSGDLRPCLIHGVTGSGKTEVYIGIIEEMLRRGKRAIVLIPEISLTYQTWVRFYSHFYDRVCILHSKLSQGERTRQFERIRSGEADVVIGPRSALFSPMPELGLIVIDEEHESSYKSESVPRYHAREVAQMRAMNNSAMLVLGSATPSVESYTCAKEGSYQLFTLPARANAGTLPQVDIVDMREELRQGNRSIFSDRLYALMEDRLQRKEQIMLFINRRGMAGFVSCRSCGTALTCPHCDVSLSLHGSQKLICHYCGFTRSLPQKCPECGSGYIGTFRAGTQKIEGLLKKEFPTARVLRMDADSTRKKDGYEQILSAFANQEADILVGTQMIVKGHDFSNVTLMGILAADLSLHISDYRAGERTFQLLTQAAGRTGRGKKSGEVVIQTYQPDHYAVAAAAAQDYTFFYEQEIAFRRMLHYPPAGHMGVLHMSSKDEALLQAAADRIKRRTERFFAENSKNFGEFTENSIEKHCKEGIDDKNADNRLNCNNKQSNHKEFTNPTEPGCQIVGPSEAYVYRVGDIYRRMLYVKHQSEKRLIEWKDAIEVFEGGTEGLSILFDLDPMGFS